MTPFPVKKAYQESRHEASNREKEKQKEKEAKGSKRKQKEAKGTGVSASPAISKGAGVNAKVSIGDGGICFTLGYLRSQPLEAKTPVPFASPSLLLHLNLFQDCAELIRWTLLLLTPSNWAILRWLSLDCLSNSSMSWFISCGVRRVETG